MSLFVVDVESDGEMQGRHSMVCFGAVLVKNMEQTFYGQTAPISDTYDLEALSVCGYSRSEHLQFPDPAITMIDFSNWVTSVNENGTRPILITDNPAYDFGWINYYLIKYVGTNVFGWSARRIGDLYCGLVGKGNARWKHLRKHAHTHHPVDDALGNADVIHHMVNEMGLKLKL